MTTFKSVLLQVEPIYWVKKKRTMVEVEMKYRRT